jgi:hypothetical protein
MRKRWALAAIVLSLTATPSNAQPYGPPSTLRTLPGGPGPSSPLSNLPASPSRDQPYPPPAAATPPASPGMSSAMPPAHRPARHGKMATKGGGRTQLSGSTADQLNREELARLQAGNFANPSAPPPPSVAPPTPR